MIIRCNNSICFKANKLLLVAHGNYIIHSKFRTFGSPYIYGYSFRLLKDLNLPL